VHHISVQLVQLVPNWFRLFVLWECCLARRHAAQDHLASCRLFFRARCCWRGLCRCRRRWGSKRSHEPDTFPRNRKCRVVTRFVPNPANHVSEALTSPAVLACLQAALLLACTMALLARPMHPLRGSLKSPAGARLYSGWALFASIRHIGLHANPCWKIPFKTPFDLRASQSWHWNIGSLGHHPTISDAWCKPQRWRSIRTCDSTRSYERICCYRMHSGCNQDRVLEYISSSYTQVDE
jgi:hypothetical protein